LSWQLGLLLTGAIFGLFLVAIFVELHRVDRLN